MSTILVAGCGQLGQAYGRELAEKGTKIYGLRRNIKGLQSPIMPICADLSAPGTLSSLPAVDTLIYVVSADKRSDPAYRNAYYSGIKNVLDALENQGSQPKQCVYISSSSVYQESTGNVVDEDSPVTSDLEQPSHWIAKGEALVQERIAQHYIVRYSGIYGPGRFHLIRQVAQGFLPTSSPVHYTNRVHHKDCVNSVIHLLRNQCPAGIYNVTDSEPASLYDVCQYIANKLQDSGIQLPVSDAVSQKRRSGNKRCSNAKLLATGYEMAYPSYKDGYRELILQWMAQQVLSSK